MLKALGKLPTAARLAELAQNPHCPGGTFVNIEPTEVMRPGASYPRLLLDALNRPKDTRPSGTLPSVRLNLQQLADDSPQVVWFGHSSYLISHRGFRILVDPVLFGTSSPVSFIGKPFPVANPYLPEDIPPIDLLVLSHDHYDHLDYVTLTKIKNRIRQVVCPLGVAPHLTYWGFDASIITELPWNDHVQVTADVSLTALPARHFSGRAFTRNKSQWNSYALQLRDYKIFIGGDSGYDKQFKETGINHGPFDIAMLECGQYGRDWPSIHMFPEETAMAANELRTKRLLPVHWGKFVLANHSWAEPIRRLVAASNGASYELITPRIGASTNVVGEAVTTRWWEEFANEIR